jgi:hypothetical protein
MIGKRKVLCLAFSLGLITFGFASLAFGGYTYLMNPNAAYSYVGGTTKITAWSEVDPTLDPTDEGFYDLPLGNFSFQFYGTPVNTARITTNGYITFSYNLADVDAFNMPMPDTSPPNAIVAPFWTDLDLSFLTGNDGVWYGFLGTAPNRRLVIEWRNVPSYFNLTEQYSFAIILYETSNLIKFQYTNVFSGTEYDYGAQSTVGVENFSGTLASQFSDITESLSNNMAIEFLYAWLTPHDFDGDFISDIGIYRKSWGAWYISPSGGGSTIAQGWGGDPSDIPLSGDYDGDGISDLAVYRRSTGAWWIIPSSTGVSYGIGWGGNASDIPVPADYDGDGITDLAVYRQSTGAWWIIPSSTGIAYGTGWGGDASDIPVPGDYDGDGKADLAVYRSSNGGWWIMSSSYGYPYGVGFGGGAADIPVPGDYDGDGKTDIAVYRQNWGAWYVSPSGGGSEMALGWGGDASDIPVPGDYDGDGLTDIAIYRKSNGAWWIIPSFTGVSYGFGLGGDSADIPLLMHPAFM